MMPFPDRVRASKDSQNSSELKKGLSPDKKQFNNKSIPQTLTTIFLEWSQKAIR
jgi:hypothetical protein